MRGQFYRGGANEERRPTPEEGGAAVISTPNDKLIRVVSGANEQWLPAVGRTVAAVKRALREVFNIDYFADALIGGRMAALTDLLAPGDTLEFVRPFGFKGGPDQPPKELQTAVALIAIDPELRKIGESIKAERLPADRSIERTLLLVTDYFMRKYGEFYGSAKPVASEVARLLLAAAVAIAEGQHSLDRAEPATRLRLKHPTLATVDGVEIPITRGQGAVLQALIAAGEAGLDVDELSKKSGHTDARNMLKRLVARNPLLAEVIRFPGVAYGRYRIS